MLQLQEAQAELEALEIQPVVVTFETLDAARAYVDETGVVWPLLIDAERQLYHAYGMHKAQLRHLWGLATMRAYWREALSGRFPRIPRADSIQQGGNVLIDPSGIVRFHHIGRGPADRPLVDTLLAVRRSTGPDAPAVSSTTGQ